MTGAYATASVSGASRSVTATSAMSVNGAMVPETGTVGTSGLMTVMVAAMTDERTAETRIAENGATATGAVAATMTSSLGATTTALLSAILTNVLLDVRNRQHLSPMPISIPLLHRWAQG